MAAGYDDILHLVKEIEQWTAATTDHNTATTVKNDILVTNCNGLITALFNFFGPQDHNNLDTNDEFLLNNIISAIILILTTFQFKPLLLDENGERAIVFRLFILSTIIHAKLKLGTIFPLSGELRICEVEEQILRLSGGDDLLFDALRQIKLYCEQYDTSIAKATFSVSCGLISMQGKNSSSQQGRLDAINFILETMMYFKDDYQISKNLILGLLKYGDLSATTSISVIPNHAIEVLLQILERRYGFSLPPSQDHRADPSLVTNLYSMILVLLKDSGHCQSAKLLATTKPQLYSILFDALIVDRNNFKSIVDIIELVATSTDIKNSLTSSTNCCQHLVAFFSTRSYQPDENIMRILTLLWRFSFNVDGLQQKFGEVKGCCEIFVPMLNENYSSTKADLVEKICLIIWTFSNNEYNREKFRQCSRIYILLQKVLVSHKERTKLLGFVLGTIGLLSARNIDTQNLFISIPNFVETIATILHKHYRDAVIVKLTCQAMTALCINNTKVIKQFVGNDELFSDLGNSTAAVGLSADIARAIINVWCAFCSVDPNTIIVKTDDSVFSRHLSLDQYNFALQSCMVIAGLLHQEDIALGSVAMLYRILYNCPELLVSMICSNCNGFYNTLITISTKSTNM